MANSSNVPEKYSGIIIEMFGAPGIGKTHIVKKLATCFQADGVSFSDRSVAVGQMSRIVRIIHKIRIIIPTLLLVPRILPFLLGFMTKAGVRGVKDFIRVLVNWLYLIALVRREILIKGLVILDQGFAQALWSTVFRGHSVKPETAGELSRVFLDACTARQLVIVSLSLDEQSHRVQLESRLHGDSPIDDGDIEKFEKAIRVTRCIGEVIDELVTVTNTFKLQKIDFENKRFGNSSILYKRLLEVIQSN